MLTYNQPSILSVSNKQDGKVGFRLYSTFRCFKSVSFRYVVNYDEVEPRNARACNQFFSPSFNRQINKLK